MYNILRHSIHYIYIYILQLRLRLLLRLLFMQSTFRIFHLPLNLGFVFVYPVQS
jgi:hypothetical protein